MTRNIKPEMDYNSLALSKQAESYWLQIKDSSKEIKLWLINKLSDSLMRESEHISVSDMTNDELIEKFAGAWHGTESPEEIMATIKAHSSSKQPPVFD